MHSLYLNLALTSFFWLHNELFMCLSPLRADRAYAFVALPPPEECARHTRGSSGLVAGAAEERVPSVQAQKGRAASRGGAGGGGGGHRPCQLVRLLLPVGGLWASPPREAGCELRGSYLCGPARVPCRWWAGGAQLRK